MAEEFDVVVDIVKGRITLSGVTDMVDEMVIGPRSGGKVLCSNILTTPDGALRDVAIRDVAVI